MEPLGGVSAEGGGVAVADAVEEAEDVDVAVAPWMVRDWVVAEHRGFDRAAVGNGWKEYVDRLERRESIVKTTSVGAATLRGGVSADACRDL